MGKGKTSGKKNVKAMSAADIDAALASMSKDATNSQAPVAKTGITKAQQRVAEEKRKAEELKMAELYQEAVGKNMEQRAQQMQLAEEQCQYINKEIPIKDEFLSWFESAPGKYIRFEQFDGSADKMDQMVNLFISELSEPYTAFTYEYFIGGWPDLCILTYAPKGEGKPSEDEKGEMIGAVISSVTRKRLNKPLTGYIAMLAIVPTMRKAKIASKLVTVTVDLMREKGCGVVALETPVNSIPALNLYCGLGFAKTKFLKRYYLEGQDAVRLKIWLTPAVMLLRQQAEKNQMMLLASQQNTQDNKDTETAVSA